MAQGVYTRQKRFTFVEKTIGEVGDGKRHCLEVTGTTREKADQLAEIYYRVNDARVTEGYLEGSFTDGGNTYYHKASFPNVAAPSEKYLYSSVASDTQHSRSYTASKFFTDPLEPEPMAWSTRFTETEEFGNVLRFRFANIETALWENGDGLDVCIYDFEVYESIAQMLNGYSDGWVSTYVAIDEDFYKFRTGFSIWMLNVVGSPAIGNGIQWTDHDDMSSYFDPPTSDSVFLFQIGQEVAWVDDDGSGNPLSAGNRIFVSLFFYAATAGFFPMSICSDRPESGYDDTGYYFKLALQSGTPKAKIYATLLGAPASVSFPDGLDFTITPTEWWPYAKDSPPVPVWDTATGLHL